MFPEAPPPISAGSLVYTARSAVAAGEVHVWRASLEVARVDERRLAGALSLEETARAHRFRFDLDRRRFVVARALLRHLIGGYLRCDPSVIRFRYGSAGKPEVEAPFTSLRFNLSHSGSHAVFAFTQGREVGVDVEHLEPMPDADRIAERFFCDAERAVLAALDGRAKDRAFFRCWTRKEAYLKALGDGLARPLDGFEVSLGATARLVAVRADEAEPSRWWLQDLQWGECVAALAIAGQKPFVSIVDLEAREAAEIVRRISGR